VTRSRVLHELHFPLTDTAVLFSMLGLFLVGKTGFLLARLLAGFAFPLGVMFGLFFAIVLLPVTSRYLMQVLDARILGRPAGPLTLGSLDRLGVLWSALPILLFGLAAWAAVAAAGAAGAIGAGLVLAAAAGLLPASLCMLVLTGSALSAVNPVAIGRLLRLCGVSWLAVPATILALAALLAAADRFGVPRLAAEAALLYLIVLCFTLPGAVVAESGAADLVEPAGFDADPVSTTADIRAAQARAVAEHAYGFFSRGNCVGGLSHIEDFIARFEELDDKTAAFESLFQLMLGWQDRRPGLLLGQRYLAFLVATDQSQRALKTLSRCLHESPDFRPLPADRETLGELAGRAGRTDLSVRLG